MASREWTMSENVKITEWNDHASDKGFYEVEGVRIEHNDQQITFGINIIKSEHFSGALRQVLIRFHDQVAREHALNALGILLTSHTRRRLESLKTGHATKPVYDHVGVMLEEHAGNMGMGHITDQNAGMIGIDAQLLVDAKQANRTGPAAVTAFLQKLEQEACTGVAASV